MNAREILVVLEAKQKEFDRLCDYALNQMSMIERGLNPASVSRHPNAQKDRWAPLRSDVKDLTTTLESIRMIDSEISVLQNDPILFRQETPSNE